MPVNPDSLYSGTYLVNVVDSTLCEITDTVIVGDNSISIQPIINNPICFGDSTGNITVSVIGGSYPYTYNWSSTNLNSNIIDSISAGLYVVEVTDSNNCSVIDSILLTQPIQLSISDSLVNVNCFGNVSGSINISVFGGVTLIHSCGVTEILLKIYII